MRTSKKALVSTISLICAVVLLSAVIIAPSSLLQTDSYQDAALRQELAGSIDFAIIGASHAGRAFLPPVLDEALGCCSYNLCQDRMTSYGKYYILEKELARNPIRTVVVEVSTDTLIREEDMEYGEGDEITLSRLDTFSEKLDYLTRYIGLTDWVNIYARSLGSGARLWAHILLNDVTYELEPEKKGQWSREAKDITLSQSAAVKLYNSEPLDTEYSQDSVDALTELIDLCHEHGARVIIAVCPVSDRAIWQYEGWDDFRAWLKSYSVEHDCDWYDFNLLRARYEILSDSFCYYNATHISNEGAVPFTAAFADILKKADAGEDTSVYFYDSYEAMKADSPYARYREESR